MENKILGIEELDVIYEEGKTAAVDKVSFFLKEEEALCLRGKSGSGKSTIVWCIMGIIRSMGGIPSGAIWYRQKDLLTLNKEELNAIRWEKIALVPQSSMDSFHPLYRMEQTFFEMLKLRRPKKSKAEWRKQCLSLFDFVHLDERAFQSYPHELSGGMRQRAAIALALLFEPEILILDEATTGLDVLVEAEILYTLKEIREKSKMSFLFISHDKRIADAFCDRRVEL